MYNAGVRYIFAEGSGSDELIVNYASLMFYPWMNSGWRYETLALYDAVKNFNDALPSDDKILIISPEKTPPDNITSRAQQWNYRDSSATQTIIEIMDAVPDETKAIIWYGAAHTVTDYYKNYYESAFSERFDWIPLGHLLRKHYGSDFLTYYFVTDHYKDMIIRQKCVLDEPKLVALKKMPIANIPILKDGLAVFSSWAVR